MAIYRLIVTEKWSEPIKVTSFPLASAGGRCAIPCKWLRCLSQMT